MMGFSTGISYFQVHVTFWGICTLRQSNIDGWKSYIVTNSRTTSIQMISQPAMLDYWTLAYLFQSKRSNKTFWFEGPTQLRISEKNYWTKSVGVNQDINSWRVADVIHFLTNWTKHKLYTPNKWFGKLRWWCHSPGFFRSQVASKKNTIGGKNPHTASLDPLPKLRDVGGKNTWWMLLMVLESGKLTSWVLENLPFVH